MSLSRPCLGNPAYLGAIYDIRTEEFTGLNVFVKDLPDALIRKSEFCRQDMNYDFSNSTSSKFSLFNIEGDFKLKLMCDSIFNVSGSAAFLKHRSKNTEEMRCTFALSIRTGEDSINVGNSDLLECFNKDIKDSWGTHVVIAVVRGKSATVELFIETKNSTNQLETKEKIEASFGKGIDTSLLNVNENQNYENVKLSNITNIRFESSNVAVTPPSNVQEAVKIIKDLPDILKEQSSNVIEFHLMPLYLLKESIGQAHGPEYIIRKVENNIITHVELIFDESERLRLEVSSLKDLFTQCKEYTKNKEIKTLSNFLKLFDIEFSKFQHSIAEKLIEVKSGTTEQKELARICHDFEQNSEIGFEKAKEILSSFQTTKERITRIMNILKKKIVVVKTSAELDSLILTKSDIFLLSYSFEKSKDFHETYWQFCRVMEENNDKAVFIIVDVDVTPDIKIDDHALSSETTIYKIHEGRFASKNVLKEIEKDENAIATNRRVKKDIYGAILVSVVVLYGVSVYKECKK